MANAMFRSDNLAGITHGKYLASVRVTEDIENGCIVALGGYEAGAREVREYTAVAADAELGKIAILGSEEVNKEVKYDTVGSFKNKKGDVARAYILEHGDIFSVSAEGFAALPSVGTTVKVAAGAYKMGTTGDVTIGECIAIEQDGATTWYVVRV